MPGGNPSADSEASTDKGDATASPFAVCLQLAETPYRERHQSVKSWGCGGKAPACNVSTKLPSEQGRPLIMHTRPDPRAKGYPHRREFYLRQSLRARSGKEKPSLRMLE